MQQFQTVHPRHTDVRQHYVVRARLRPRQPFQPVVGALDLPIRPPQHRRHELVYGGIVVHQQQRVPAHAVTSFSVKVLPWP